MPSSRDTVSGADSYEHGSEQAPSNRTGEKKRFSIVVPARNEAAFLPGLLKSIRQHVKLEVEIIVVVNGSTDATADIAREQGCQVIVHSQKLMPGQARNLGWSSAKAPTIVFLDADVEVTQQWGNELAALDDRLLASAEVVTGDQYHVSREPSLIEKLWFRPMRAKAPSYINGGNIIVSRAVLEKIQGFDSLLETGEDVDFCRRAVEAGAVVRINEGFAVRHEGFPKDAVNFVKRERWHGRGDLISFDTFLRSRVALSTAMFAGLHLALLISFLMAASGLAPFHFAAAFLALIVLECGLTAVYKFRRSGLLTALGAAPVAYLYYLGRAWSMLDRLATLRSAGSRRSAS